jgi:sugar phosphate isomerase/epimerase
VWPGEGVAPLKRIIETLKRKKYAGPVSVEMFHPDIQAMDPYEVAKKARAVIEPLIG